MAKTSPNRVPRVGTFHDGQAYRNAIFLPSAKTPAHFACYYDNGVVAVRKVDRADLRYVTYFDDYPVTRAVARLRAAGKRNRITKQAVKFLRDARTLDLSARA